MLDLVFNISASFFALQYLSSSLPKTHFLWKLPEDSFLKHLPLIWSSPTVTRVSSLRIIVMLSLSSNSIECTCFFYPIKMSQESYLISLNVVFSSINKDKMISVLKGSKEIIYVKQLTHCLGNGMDPIDGNYIYRL